MSQNPDALALYFQNISKVSLLTQEEELDLIIQAQAGDKEALSRIIEANARFVVKEAKRYQGQGLELIDLISEANIGLMEAVSRFQVERGYRFISYAVHWIRQSMLKAIAETGSAIRLPQNRINELSKIRRTSAELQEAYEREITSSEIADELNMNPEQVEKLLTLSQSQSSLSYMKDEKEGSSLGDTIADSSIEDFEEGIYQENIKKQVELLLKTLSERDGEIIQYRFGLGDKPCMTLKQLSERFNLTKERIRQIEVASIKKLALASRM